MTNEEYFQTLTQIVHELKKLRDNEKSVAISTVANTFTKKTILICSSADRCIQIIDGIICMLNERNLTCVGALLRIQIDNCMRLNAVNLTEDEEKVIDCLLYETKKINHIKSKNGDMLTDCYLKSELQKRNQLVSDIYKATSGYIHFSDRAFYQMINKCNDKEIEIGVGIPLLEKHNPLLIKMADAFVNYVQLHLELLDEYIKRE